MRTFLVWNKSTSCIERGYLQDNNPRDPLLCLMNGIVHQMLDELYPERYLNVILQESEG